MGMPVVTVASGGMPVVDVTSTNKIGTPVTEAANGYGIPVTKIGVNASKGAIPVVYVAATVQLRVLSDGQASRGRARALARGQTQRAPGAL